MMSALHCHTSDSPTLNLLYMWVNLLYMWVNLLYMWVNLLYMWALSLLCPVLSLNRMTCSGLLSLWKLSYWFEFGCCSFHFFLQRVLIMVFSSV